MNDLYRFPALRERHCDCLPQRCEHCADAAPRAEHTSRRTVALWFAAFVGVAIPPILIALAVFVRLGESLEVLSARVDIVQWQTLDRALHPRRSPPEAPRVPALHEFLAGADVEPPLHTRHILDVSAASRHDPARLYERAMQLASVRSDVVVTATTLSSASARANLTSPEGIAGGVGVAQDSALPAAGILLVRVDAESLPGLLGLRPGDRIMRINGYEVPSTRQSLALPSASRGGPMLVAEVQRGSHWVVIAVLVDPPRE